MTTNEEKRIAGDLAAQKAEKEFLDALNAPTLRVVTQWYEKWYRTAGHKRLGKVILKASRWFTLPTKGV